MPHAITSLVKERQYQLIDQMIHYQLVHSQRKTIGFTISDKGLRISAPKWVSAAQIEASIEAHQKWILKKLQEWKKISEVTPITWQKEMHIPFLGKLLHLQFNASLSRTIFNEVERQVHMAIQKDSYSEYAFATVSWLKHQAKQLFSKHLAHYSQLLQININQFKLSSARSKWGSCTSQRNIYLCWRLIYFPESVIQYVIAHEVAHLREMNHSKQFWQLVETLYPDYRKAKDFLDHPPESIQQFVKYT